MSSATQTADAPGASPSRPAASSAPLSKTQPVRIKLRVPALSATPSARASTTRLTLASPAAPSAEPSKTLPVPTQLRAPAHSATPSARPSTTRPTPAAPSAEPSNTLHVPTQLRAPAFSAAALARSSAAQLRTLASPASPGTTRPTPTSPAALAALTLASLLFGATLAAQPTDLPGWLTAIEATDRSVLSSKATVPNSLPAALRPRLPKMKDQSRVLAAQVLEKLDSAEGGSVLLTLTADPNLAVAASASRALRNAKNLPPGEEILQVIPKTENPALRAHLYLAAGRAKTPLPSLQQLAEKEQDPQARNTAMAAAIRLGGMSERAKLAAAIRAARMEDVVRLTDLILYIGDKSMAPALLPLFDSQEPIFSISPGPNSRMARRCDIAVWTTHQLGLVPALKLTSIRNFDNATISVAKAAAAKGKDK